MFYGRDPRAAIAPIWSSSAAATRSSSPPGSGCEPRWPASSTGSSTRRAGAPARTLDPAGVIDFDRSDLTLGDLFAIWGEPLSRRRLAGFSGPVTAFVAGRRVPGDPASIPLRDGAQIVLQVGGYIRPHRQFLFPA